MSYNNWETSIDTIYRTNLDFTSFTCVCACVCVCMCLYAILSYMLICVNTVTIKTQNCSISTRDPHDKISLSAVLTLLPAPPWVGNH